MDIAGIILIGGKSRRMGTPKALINFQGDPLYLKIARLMEKYVDKVYISGTLEQKIYWSIDAYPFIVDRYANIGPMAGIASSFFQLKGEACALLTVATDMPLLELSTFENLIKARNKNKMATLFRNAQSGYLEPLFAIYEYTAYQRFLDAIDKEQFSVQRIFEEHELQLIDYTENKTLTNINYPDQLNEL